LVSSDARLTCVREDIPLSVSKQCKLLQVNRSSYYYKPKLPSKEELDREENIKARLDFWHTKFCWMGSRKLLDKLRKDDKSGCLEKPFCSRRPVAAGRGYHRKPTVKETFAA
jgi:putative transposase